MPGNKPLSARVRNAPQQRATPRRAVSAEDIAAAAKKRQQLVAEVGALKQQQEDINARIEVMQQKKMEAETFLANNEGLQIEPEKPLPINSEIARLNREISENQALINALSERATELSGSVPAANESIETNIKRLEEAKSARKPQIDELKRATDFTTEKQHAYDGACELRDGTKAALNAGKKELRGLQKQKKSAESNHEKYVGKADKAAQELVKQKYESGAIAFEIEKIQPVELDVSSTAKQAWKWLKSVGSSKSSEPEEIEMDVIGEAHEAKDTRTTKEKMQDWSKLKALKAKQAWNKSRIKKLTSNIIRYEGEIKANGELVSKLHGKISEKESVIEVAETALKEDDKNVTKAESELDDAKTVQTEAEKTEALFAEAEDKAESELNEATEAHTAIESELASVQEDIAEFISHNETNSAALVQAKEKKADMLQEYSDSAKQQVKDKITVLNDEIAKAGQHTENVTVQISSKNLALAEVKLLQAQQDVERFNLQLAQIEPEYVNAQNATSVAKQVYQAAQNAREPKEKIEKLEKAYMEKQVTSERLGQSVSQLYGIIQNAEQNLNMQKQEVQKAAVQIESPVPQTSERTTSNVSTPPLATSSITSAATGAPQYQTPSATQTTPSFYSSPLPSQEGVLLTTPSSTVSAAEKENSIETQQNLPALEEKLGDFKYELQLAEKNRNNALSAFNLAKKGNQGSNLVELKANALDLNKKVIILKEKITSLEKQIETTKENIKKNQADADEAGVLREPIRQTPTQSNPPSMTSPAIGAPQYQTPSSTQTISSFTSPQRPSPEEQQQYFLNKEDLIKSKENLAEMKAKYAKIEISIAQLTEQKNIFSSKSSDIAEEIAKQRIILSNHKKAEELHQSKIDTLELLVNRYEHQFGKSSPMNEKQVAPYGGGYPPQGGNRPQGGYRPSPSSSYPPSSSMTANAVKPSVSMHWVPRSCKITSPVQGLYQVEMINKIGTKHHDAEDLAALDLMDYMVELPRSPGQKIEITGGSDRQQELMLERAYAHMIPADQIGIEGKDQAYINERYKAFDQINIFKNEDKSLNHVKHDLGEVRQARMNPPEDTRSYDFGGGL